MTKIAIGSVVRLKSGGAQMVVDNVAKKLCELDESKRLVCYCRWMTRDSLQHSDWFDVESLNLIDQE
jgi:uncharacterized protein YodC (DUF2158 family)